MNIMRMAFLERCGGNFYKLSVLLKLFNGSAAAVTHAAPQAPHKLEDGIFNRALIGNAAFNAFGNKLLCILLEVTVFASGLHGGYGAHAAVNLIFSALVKLKCSRAFIGSGKERADHYNIGTGSNGLGYIT